MFTRISLFLKCFLSRKGQQLLNKRVALDTVLKIEYLNDVLYYSSDDEIPLTSAFVQQNQFENVTVCINDSITSIEDSAFSGNSFIQTFIIDSSVFTSIGANAFSKCTALKYMDCGLTQIIMNSAFSGCSSLTNLTAESVTELKESAFSSCSSLSKIEFPLLETVGAKAFSSCYKLNNINFPNATSIDDTTFNGCFMITSIKLEKVTTFPDFISRVMKKTIMEISLGSVTTIPSNAIVDFKLLVAVVGFKITRIEPHNFINCPLLAGMGTPLMSIGTDCFVNCSILSVVVFTLVQEIEDGCFINCPKLTGIDLKVGKRVGAGSFINNEAIKTITANSLTEIGDGSFIGFKQLTTFTAPSLTTIGADSFSQCPNITTIDFPLVEEVLGSSFIDSNHVTLINLPKIDEFGDYIFNNAATLQSITMAGDSEVPDNAFSNFPALTNVTFTDVEIIGNNAFKGCSKLETISIDKAIEIKSGAFYGCNKIQTMNIPNAETIGNEAFYECTSLDVLVVTNVETIGDSEFYGCISLQTLDISCAKTVGTSAFSGCTAVASVNAQLVESFGNKCFYGCTALSNVNVLVLETIGDECFSACNQLSSFDDPELISIGNRAFFGCSLLTNFVFGGKMTTIGEFAFSEAGLTSIEFLKNEISTFPCSAFYKCPLTTITLRSDHLHLKKEDDILFGASKNILIYPTYVSLSSFSIPEGNRVIDSYSICSNPDLTELIIPSSTIKILDNAFEDCPNLENVTYCGDKSISTNAFIKCNNVVEVYVTDLYKISSFANLPIVVLKDPLSVCPFYVPNKETYILPDELMYEDNGLIIRGNDIVEIKDTHPPVQTKYVKTELPVVTKAVSITTGSILIIIILVIAVLNFIRTTHEIRRKEDADPFEIEEENELDETTSSFLEELIDSSYSYSA